MVNPNKQKGQRLPSEPKSKKSKNKKNNDFVSHPYFTPKSTESHVSFIFGERNYRYELVALSATKYDLNRLYQCSKTSAETLRQAVLELPVIKQMQQKCDVSKILKIILRDLPDVLENAEVIDLDKGGAA